MGIRHKKEDTKHIGDEKLRKVKTRWKHWNTACRHMSVHVTRLSVTGTVDYGNKRSPTRRWPQLTVVSEVEGAVHTELTFHQTAKQFETWGARTLWHYQHKTYFVSHNF